MFFFWPGRIPKLSLYDHIRTTELFERSVQDDIVLQPDGEEIHQRELAVQ